MSQELNVLQITIEEQSTYIEQKNLHDPKLNLYAFKYGINLINILQAFFDFDVVFYEYQKKFENIIFSYINIIDNVLSKKNKHIRRIIACVQDDMDGELLNYIKFKYEHLNLSNKEYREQAYDLCKFYDHNVLVNKKIPDKKLELNELPSSKKLNMNNSLFRTHITKDGIEYCAVLFDKPVSLTGLISVVEAIPVAYLEKYYTGKILKKARILGINRMKYSRLIDRSKSFSNLI